jgi:nucleoside-diphosphate-sugar epimerase
LITGGTGFIGAWIIRHLRSTPTQIRVLDLSTRHDIVDLVLGADANKVEWLQGDISDGGTVAQAAQGCDAIVHLAGLQVPACQKDPILGAKVNVIGTLNVFEAAKRYSIKNVVYMSTAAVFGPQDGSTPNPITHYGSFKLATEGCARSYWLNDRIGSIGFRPYVVYGPGRDIGLTAGVSLACRAAALGERYVIPFTGGADFLYVEDLAEAIIAAVKMPPDGAHIFSLPGEVGDTDRIIAEIVKNVPAAKITAEGVRNPTAQKLTGNDMRETAPGLPNTSLADGIRATIEFFRSQSRHTAGTQQH